MNENQPTKYKITIVIMIKMCSFFTRVCKDFLLIWLANKENLKTYFLANLHIYLVLMIFEHF